MPHGQCYLWSPGLIWLHGVSDSLIALAYFSIPLALLYFIRGRRDIPYRGIFWMFAVFIISCGATHGLEVWTIWHSNYYVTGGVKAFTATVSLATAFAMVRIMPEALQLRGPAELNRLNESLEERVKLRTNDLESSNARLRNEITERQSAEAEVKRLNHLLQRRVDELQALFDALPVGVGIAEEPTCRAIRMNRGLSDILGMDRQTNASLSAPAGEAPAGFEASQHGRNLRPDELPMQTCARENRAMLGFEVTVRRTDGTTIELICNAVPLRDGDGNSIGCVGTFQPVTRLKKALAESARYAAIVTSSEDAIIGLGLDGRITDWNRAAEKIFGHPAELMIGADASLIVPPELREEEAGMLARIRAGETVSPNESEGLTRDSTRVDVSIMISPIRDESGHMAGFSKLARDITARRRAERDNQKLERKIQDTQKLESLGVLAGGIAHDFNNLLTAIVGNASLAGLSLPASSTVSPYLKQIEQASMRASELCSQMLAYAGQGRFTLKKIDLNHLITETTQLLAISIGKTVLLRQNLADTLPAIEGDGAQIRQIVMNLVINASESIGSRSGVVAITTGVVRVDDDYMQTLLHPAGLKTGDYVFIEVSDNGCGMDAGTLKRIFDPFFTTKFTGRGLGLAAVLGIVRGHHGALKVYSEPGRGTTFKLLLPASDSPAEPHMTDDPPLPAAAVSGRVMVVDDEETVRTVATRMMETMGYTVDMAEDGRVAVELFRKEPASYRLILVDLTMPHLNGEETFRQLRHIRPGISVVLMSGFNEQDAMSAFAGKGLAGFIQKPFTANTFTKAIHSFMMSR